MSQLIPLLSDVELKLLISSSTNILFIDYAAMSSTFLYIPFLNNSKPLQPSCKFHVPEKHKYLRYDPFNF